MHHAREIEQIFEGLTKNGKKSTFLMLAVCQPLRITQEKNSRFVVDKLEITQPNHAGRHRQESS